MDYKDSVIMFPSALHSAAPAPEGSSTESLDQQILGLPDSLQGYREILRLGCVGDIQEVYAPFDFVNLEARLVIVGITPGEQQAMNALRAYRERRTAGGSIADAIKVAKSFASFSGPMRKSLTEMMDAIGLDQVLGLASTAEVFEIDSTFCHFTSVLRYPVFVNGQNYSGSPSPIAHPYLWSLVKSHFVKEVAQLPDAIWLPLGSAVTQVMQRLVNEGLIDEERVLFGLPHPSGANSERINYFVGRKSKAALSVKTRPDVLDKAKAELVAKVSAMLPNNGA